MKISFFQFTPIFNNLKHNISLVKEFINKNLNKIEETDLLVFPEYFLSGPLDLKSFVNYKKQLDEINISSVFTNISKIIPKTTIIFGSTILPKKNIYLNSSQVYLNGQNIGEYDKKALIYNENHICKSTDSYFKFEVNGIRVGVALCWDLILPEVFRRYVGEVDLVVVPSFWGLGANALQAKYTFSLEKKYYRELCVARAYENSFALLFVNAVGIYSSDFYSDRMMGGSLAVMPPLGETYFTNSKKSQELHVIDLDFDFLKQYREFYATDKDYKYYKTKNIF